MNLDRELDFRFPMMRGDDVRAVQLALLRAGSSNLVADGVFGPTTKQAVIDFQTRMHAENAAIAINGRVGRDTWSGLFADCAPVQVASKAAAPPPLVLASAATDRPAWMATLRAYLVRANAEEMHGPPIGSGDRRWRLTPDGVVISPGDSPRGSGGQPLTARKVWTQFRAPLEKCAAAYGVPVELLIATACTESGGDPTKVREEPKYETDESTPNQVSPGLMQTLIDTARGATGDASLNRAKLLEPGTAIRAGAAYIRQQADRAVRPTNFDPPLVAIAYNAGSLVPVPAIAPNNWGLRQTARPPKMHADVFAAFVNDAFAVLAESNPDRLTPSFRSLLRAEG
jgi:soluble lytic murein transglycosylase-like protein